jgi:folate-binding protein YgfZ
MQWASSGTKVQWFTGGAAAPQFQGYNHGAVWREDSVQNLANDRRKASHMTETDLAEIDLAATIQPTPLAALLETSSKPHQLSPYRGVLSPVQLDAPEREIEALAKDAAVHDLGWLRRVAVHGEDRFRWLSGMITNTVNELEPRGGAWNLVLNAQGRVQGDLTVWRENDTLELDIAADQYEKLKSHLERFIIMDDVELVDLSGEAALGLTGPAADEVLGRLSLPTLSEPMTGTRVEWIGFDLRILRGYGALVPHYELWIPLAGLAKLWLGLRTAAATPVGTAAIEVFRIAEGIPAYGVDIVERDLAHETSQMRALHFNKGCYLGQEVVERVRSRGSVHRHLRQLEIFGPVPPPGTELHFDDGALDGETAAGHITSAAELALPTGKRAFALGMIRGSAETRNQALHYSAATGNGTARILDAAPKL